MGAAPVLWRQAHSAQSVVMCSMWQGYMTCPAACRLRSIQATSPCALQFYELARKEIGALILSDEHPNIVRCFAMEEDSEFVYLALERCRQSLADLVTGEGGHVFLVDEAKHPTPFCMQASRLAGPQAVCWLPPHCCTHRLREASVDHHIEAGVPAHVTLWS